MISRFITVSTAAIVFATPALAHPGHIDAASHGHSHWLGYAILAGLALWGVSALLRRRANRSADETSGN